MKNIKPVAKRSLGTIKKFFVGAGATMSMAAAMVMPASAAEINTGATTESVVGGIVEVIIKIVSYIGIVIAIIGVVNFILSFKDGNSEQQSNGIRLALIGTALLGIRVLLKLAGLIL